jgi:SAM-dependent methyltransferase
MDEATAGALRARAAAYYESKLLAHGPTAQGVDWNSEASQRLRFEQLLRIMTPDVATGTLIDYGCGYGALADYVAERHPGWAYCGFDVSEKMIAAARSLHPAPRRMRFTSDPNELERATYAVASGVFNVKGDADDQTWTAYLLDALGTLARLSEGGFAFNVLTTNSDPDRRRSNLYYADPLRLFDECRRRFSPRVAILHDYPLFEFTIIVRS